MNVDKQKIGLVLMIGLPGSGKSTLTKTVAQYIREKSSTYKVHEIVYDELIPASIQSGSDVVSWRQARLAVIDQVKCLICQAKEEKNGNSSITIIIVDDNMYYRSMRYTYFQIARLYGISFCQLYLSISLDVALDRNNCRTLHRVPTEVFTRMSTRLQPPDSIHNIWEKNSISVCSNDIINTYNIYTFIITALDDIVPPLAVDLAPEMKRSVIHEADLELRKIIGVMVRDERGDKRGKAAELNDQRRQLLERLRIGDMSLPDVDQSSFLAQQLLCEEYLAAEGLLHL